MNLTFKALRIANLHRLSQFKNRHGQLVHSKPDGSDWSPAQWLQAVIGELGEYANERKKFERGDLTAEEFQIKAGKELADVLIYLDILAAQLGLDLGFEVAKKFNEVSDRVGSTIFINERSTVVDKSQDIGTRDRVLYNVDWRE
jgi:NTP pyrophosphatase (non-canonical NTP hydrolase)